MPAAHDSPAAAPVAPALRIVRTFDAPRDLVWKAWTDPAHLVQWWGPHGFTNPRCEVDVRVGGAIRIDMRGPDGAIYPMTGRFDDIVAPERLVFMSGPIDEHGNTLFEGINTVTFVEHDGKTTVTLEMRIAKMTPIAPQFLKGAEQGWGQSLERLGALVEEPDRPFAQREMLTQRMLDAPRDLVWRAWTEPEQIVKWWGPNGFRTTIHEMDVRPGGVWRFVMHGPDGRDYPNHIVYTDVDAPRRLAYRHLGGPLFTSSATFGDHGDKTIVSLWTVFDSVSDYDDAVNNYKAIEGAKQTLGRLAAHLQRVSS